MEKEEVERFFRDHDRVMSYVKKIREICREKEVEGLVASQSADLFRMDKKRDIIEE